MKFYQGDNCVSLPDGKSAPGGMPSANAANAELKDLIKWLDANKVKGQAQANLRELDGEDVPLLMNALSLMPRQLRKKLLKKVGLKIVVKS